MSSKHITTRPAVESAINDERAYQKEKWFGDGEEIKRTPTEYILYSEEYVDECISMAIHDHNEEALHALRKVAALGVASLELNQFDGRREGVFMECWDTLGRLPIHAPGTLLDAMKQLKAFIRETRSSAARRRGDNPALEGTMNFTAFAMECMIRFGVLRRDMSLPVSKAM